MSSKNNNTIIISFSIVMFLILILLLLFTYNSKIQNENDNYESFNQSGYKSVASISNETIDVNKASEGVGDFQPSDPLGDEIFNPVNSTATVSEFNDEETCFPKDRLTASDLLPNDAANSKWAQLNPASSGDVSDQNFLTAGYHIGINTVGQSLRNANLQLRSEPPNPQVPVSAFLNSTITAEPSMRTLEIGSSPSLY